MENKAKYHHLIPQTYMASWANKSGTLLVRDKVTGRTENKNKEKIFGKKNYHSIIAGMPICTADDARIIFSAVKDLDVYYQDHIVSDPIELNQIYYDFDNWNIIRPVDGSSVSKKQIRAAIDKVKIRDIEAAWASKYENQWPGIRKLIEDNALNARNGEISEFQKKYLMCFYTSMDWRGFATDEMFAQQYDTLCKDTLALNEINIPEEERELPFFETAYDYFRHCLLLKFFRRFLADDGPMYTHAMQSMKYTSFHFLIADDATKFVTSDNPAFWYTRDDGLKAGVMPISPNILMAQGRKSDDSQTYSVTHITDAAVQKYNKVIEENAYQYVILNNSGI